METSPNSREGIEEIVKTFGNELAMHLTPSNEAMKAVRFVREAFADVLHQELQKALRCGKGMGDGSICGCKLDCHLHDWRQRDELQKARQTWLREEIVKLEGIKSEIPKIIREPFELAESVGKKMFIDELIQRHRTELNQYENTK